MSIKARLAKLEVKLTPVPDFVIVFSVDGVFDEEQQALKEQAGKEGRRVDVVNYEIV